MIKKRDIDFDNLLKKGDRESLEECRDWLKSEEKRIALERERMEAESLFFEKKMDILKNGYASLEEDRKKLERERISFETEKKITKEFHSQEAYEDLAGNLFAGVNSYLALKKRYRDLLKIFHPDNMCGDHEMVTIITAEYERIKNEMEYSFKSVK